MFDCPDDAGSFTTKINWGKAISALLVEPEAGIITTAEPESASDFSGRKAALCIGNDDLQFTQRFQFEPLQHFAGMF